MAGQEGTCKMEEIPNMEPQAPPPPPVPVIPQLLLRNALQFIAGAGKRRATTEGWCPQNPWSSMNSVWGWGGLHPRTEGVPVERSLPVAESTTRRPRHAAIHLGRTASARGEWTEGQEGWLRLVSAPWFGGWRQLPVPPSECMSLRFQGVHFHGGGGRPT